MNARNELSDLTTPLGSPDVVDCFAALLDRRFGLPEFSRSLLEACRDDAHAANDALLLLDDYCRSGRLKSFDLRTLKRELQRLAFDHNQRISGAFDGSDPSVASPLADPTVAPDLDPTRAYAMPTSVVEDEMSNSPPRPATAPDLDPTRAYAMPTSVVEDEMSNSPPRPATAPDMDPTRAYIMSTSVVDDDIDVDAAASESAGKSVGPANELRDRYVLQEVIGRGGAGTVYRALDRNRADLPQEQQYIALKVLSDEHARHPAALHALRREFLQAQSLSHPGIVNVFDFDQDDGTYFVTMELIDGEPLGALMRRIQPRKLAREPALRILRELGEAIAYAHGRDVLHMDLKPGNVMVTRQGQVRVLDFGLAETFMPEPWISHAALTFHAATPAYASCERLLGDVPDVRDDIFSFSCLAYELLSGRHPFDRRSALDARNDGRKPRRIVTLSRHQWHALRSGLAWKREDRPGSMEELLHGLALQADAPRRSARRRSQARPSVAWRPVAALSLLVLGVAAALTWNRLPTDLREIVGERAAASGRAIAQATETARLWTTSQLAMLADDTKQTAATVASSTPAPAPRIEPATPVVIAPASDVPDIATTAVNPAASDQPPKPVAVETPTATPLATDEPPKPAVTEMLPPDTTRPVAPSRTGSGPGALELTSSTLTVAESNSVARVSVRRRGGAEGEISFDWRTVDDSAVAGEDYAAPETVPEVMGDGQATATLMIPIVADAVPEHTELFEVVIEDPTNGARLGTVTRVPVIIVDDD